MMQYSGHKPPPLQIYGSFLLRCWQDRTSLRWRFVLESVTSKEEMHFGDIHGLMEYLENQFNNPIVKRQSNSNQQDSGGMYANDH